MRRALLFAHRWLGLTAGLIFSITALTGGILVYEEELNDLLIGARVGITPGFVDPSMIESSAMNRYPQSRILRVEWPTPETKVFIVRMAAGEKKQSLEVDPGSGSVLGSRNTPRIVTALRRFHGSLLIGSIGRAMVAYSTIASIVSLLLGLYLWWPGIRHIARGFRIRFGKGFYPVTYDLHQTSGMIALPLLLVMSLSGVLMDSWAMRAFTQSGWKTPRSAGASEANAADIDLSTVVRVAQTATEGGRIVRVDFPANPDDGFQVWTASSKWSQGAATRLALDRHSALVLARQDLAYDANLNDRLHFASIGGPIVRLLYFVACLIGAGLFLTGVLMWWKKGNSSGGQRRPVPVRSSV